MANRAHIHMLPALGDPEVLTGGMAIVIDVLRATTTIVEALTNGAKAVLPTQSVEQAESLAAGMGQGSCLLGGERQGVKLPGFDLGNSPLEYGAEIVSGKSVVFTTTNGTKALLWASVADTILTASFTNRAAIIEHLRPSNLPIHFVCAGTDGHLTAEDILLAGSIASALDIDVDPLDVATQMGLDFAQRNGATPDDILRTLRESRGGQNLLRLDADRDISFAAQCDCRPTIPVFDSSTSQLAPLE